MPSSERSIFRESAVKRYHQRQEQGIVLRVASPPAFLIFWIVSLLFLGAGGFAWAMRVPTFANGQGVVVEPRVSGQSGQEVDAMLFFPPGTQTAFHAGQSATVTIGSPATSVTGTVEQVDTSVISPDEARSRFNLQGGLTQVITGPSIIILIHLGSAASAQMYAGSACSAQVQIGSQSVLSLLPVLNQLFGT